MSLDCDIAFTTAETMSGMSAAVKGRLDPSSCEALVLSLHLLFCPASTVDSLALLLAGLLFLPATAVVESLAPLLACFLFLPATVVDSFDAGEL